MIIKFPMKEDVLTAEELSKYINITPAGWALRRSKNDGPPFIKIKHEVRYLWKDVLKWISKESSHKASLHKRNELLYKRFEEVKTEMPNFSNQRIAHIIAHEFNLTVGTSAFYICNYVKNKKEENGEETQNTSLRARNNKIPKISFKEICERYDEIKTDSPEANSYIIAKVIAEENNVSHGHIYKNIRKYINSNKKKNQTTLKPKSIVTMTSSQIENSISKKSSLGGLGSAILNILKSKNSTNTKNL